MRYQLQALALSASLSLASSEPAINNSRMCSVRGGPGRSRAESVLLTTSSPDTVLVGPGTVLPVTLGSGAPAPIYGQVFEVTRFAGADSARLATAFRGRRDRRVAIVPWGYDSLCRPGPWTLGFGWVPRASAGTFTVRLRPDSLWTNGMPVFDALMTSFEPYPLNQPYRPERIRPELRTNEQLNAAEYFELLMGLPPHEVQQEQPDSAWEAFVDWQQSNPALAELWPANEAAFDLAASMSYVKSKRAIRSIDPVIAGTYRMTLRLDGGTEKTFYVRTRPRALDEWKLAPRPEPPALPDPASMPSVPEAYNIMASGAAFLEQLSTDCMRDRVMEREGYMYVIDPPVTGSARRTQWQGWIESSLLARQFPEDSALERFSRQEFIEWSGRYGAATEREAPARFWLDNRATLRVEQTMRLRDGRTLVVRGERVSTTVTTCEY